MHNNNLLETNNNCNIQFQNQEHNLQYINFKLKNLITKTYLTFEHTLNYIKNVFNSFNVNQLLKIHSQKTCNQEKEKLIKKLNDFDIENKNLTKQINNQKRMIEDLKLELKNQTKLADRYWHILTHGYEFPIHHEY